MRYIVFLLENIKHGPLGQVRVNWLCRFSFLLVHFFARPKKRTKKMTPVSLGPADCLALLEIAGILKTRFAQTVQNPLSAFSAVLSKCQWENNLSSPLQRATKAGSFEPGFLLTVVLLFFVSLLSQPGKAIADGYRVTQDQIGRTVKIPVQPRRIVSLIPSLTEIVFDLGRGDLLVGATQYAKEPPEAADLPRIGSYLHLDIERIVALQPDLCLAVRDGNPEHLVRRIEKFGIPVFAFDSQDLPEIIDSVKLMGNLLNASDRAAEIIREMQLKIDAVEKRIQSMQTRPGVFFQIDANPMVSAGHNTFIDRLITMAGGRNLAAGDTTYPRYSWEDILVMQPEVVIIASMAGGYTKEALMEAWTRWPQLPAVKMGRVHVVDANLFDRPVPRLADGLVALARLIHPEPDKP